MTRRRPVMVGVDPGKTTGIALYDKGHFSSLQLAREDAVPFLRGWLASQRLVHEYVVLVAERFVRGSADGHHHSTQGDAEELLADLTSMWEETMAETAGSMVLQGAGDAKTVVNDVVLGLVGWRRPGLVHANDAARHLGTRMLRLYPEEWARALAGECRYDPKGRRD